jgi:hypothetical protein
MNFLPVLQFWRDIEMFQVFNLDDVLTGESPSWWIDPNAPVIGVPPWIEPELWGLDPEYLYGYDLFLGVFEKGEAYRVFQSLYDAAEFAERFDESRDLDGNSCVIRLGVGSNGEFLIDDCRLATLPQCHKPIGLIGSCTKWQVSVRKAATSITAEPHQPQ